uniref:Caspase recruitment domain-containing protein 19 n=1 Tax=Oncorhynchus kisutch TaxID=8019 RepID=A0A8C7CX24_ONCKI
MYCCRSKIRCNVSGISGKVIATPCSAVVIMVSRREGPLKGKKGLYTMGDSFHDQLLEDSRFLRTDRRLDTELVDKLILQLNRIYPQILTDKEATKFRDLDVPTCVRLAELLAHLQGKGEEACREFYRALHLHMEEVYFSLPTRLRLRDSVDPFTITASPTQPRYVLNDRGPLFFLSCFGVAVGMALLYYYGGEYNKSLPFFFFLSPKKKNRSHYVVWLFCTPKTDYFETKLSLTLHLHVVPQIKLHIKLDFKGYLKIATHFEV